jgi:hypothetical protein
MGLGGLGGGDFRRRLGRQVQPETFEKQHQLRLGLGVSGYTKSLKTAPMRPFAHPD